MELFRALAVLVEPPDRVEVAALARLLELGEPPHVADYTETFVFQLPPFASVYLGAEGMLGGEARERVAGFLAALGRTPPPEPDHLTTLLATYAELSAHGDDYATTLVETADAHNAADEDEDGARRRASSRVARKAFLWEHLLSWLPAYLDKLSEIAPPFYCRWSELLLDALLAEAAVLGQQDALPLHLREAAPLADPRAASADEFLQTLLAPARSGLIVTRADLARAARALGAGLRAGERKFALKSLLGQDAAGALAWLAEEASMWAKRHARHSDALGRVAVWWTQRAEASATLLRELASDAHEAT
jgi:TorA maturation chaperone TorD